MEYVKLGRSGLKISRLCLGTMNFGKKLDENGSHELLDLAVDSGVNLIDTADVYGGKNCEGLSEQVIGRWFARSPGNREKAILATKVYGVTGPRPNDARLSAYHVIRACEESLRRLRTDRIDLYQMHHIDRGTTWDEIWQAMEKLVQDGKVLYIGSSNFPAWQIAKASENAKRRNFLGLVSEQSIYNLCERTVELELLPACEDYGIGFLCWSPLNGGALAKRTTSDDRNDDPGNEKWRNRQSRLDGWFSFCAEKGRSPESVAQAWLLANPLVTSIVIGPSKVSHFRSSLDSVGVHLEQDELERVDEIWPGPGGPAPEAYAW